MLNESIPTASARTASSMVLRITTSPLSSLPDWSTLTATNESSPNSISCAVIACSSPLGVPDRSGALRWFLDDVAGGRRDTHDAYQQFVERRPLARAQGAEQIVFDKAKPAVGETELVGAAR